LTAIRSNVIYNVAHVIFYRLPTALAFEFGKSDRNNILSYLSIRLLMVLRSIIFITESDLIWVLLYLTPRIPSPCNRQDNIVTIVFLDASQTLWTTKILIKKYKYSYT